MAEAGAPAASQTKLPSPPRPKVPTKGAKRTVLFLVVLAVGVAVVKRAINEGVTRSAIVQPKALIGGLIVASVLLVVAERVPKLATALAVTIAITAIMSDPERTIDAVTRITKTESREQQLDAVAETLGKVEKAQ